MWPARGSSASRPRPAASPPTPRLAKAIGTSAQLWFNLQTKFDLEIAEAASAPAIAKIAAIEPVKYGQKILVLRVCLTDPAILSTSREIISEII